MPLLNIVGISATYHSFNAGFVFLREETEKNYRWALESWKEASKINPVCITTDRELALIKAIRIVFPNAKNLVISLNNTCSYVFGILIRTF